MTSIKSSSSSSSSKRLSFQRREQPPSPAVGEAPPQSDEQPEQEKQKRQQHQKQKHVPPNLLPTNTTSTTTTRTTTRTTTTSNNRRSSLNHSFLRSKPSTCKFDVAVDTATLYKKHSSDYIVGGNHDDDHSILKKNDINTCTNKTSSFRKKEEDDTTQRLSTQTTATTTTSSTLSASSSVSASSEEELYYGGPYAHIRKTLDHKYHEYYTKERQWLQDSIIDKLLNEIVQHESIYYEKSRSNSLSGNNNGNNINGNGSSTNSNHGGGGTGGESIMIDSTAVLPSSSSSSSSQEQQQEQQQQNSTKNHGDSSSINTTTRSLAELSLYNEEFLCLLPSNPWLVYIAGSPHISKKAAVKAFIMEEVNSSSSPFSSSSSSSSTTTTTTTTTTQKDNSNNNNRFPILGFVLVDPEEIQSLFPEYSSYLHQYGKIKCMDLMRKETGYITEILIKAALKKGLNVIVFTSFFQWKKKNATAVEYWYTSYFDLLRKDVRGLQMAILHILSEEEENEYESGISSSWGCGGGNVISSSSCLPFSSHCTTTQRDYVSKNDDYDDDDDDDDDDGKGMESSRVFRAVKKLRPLVDYYCLFRMMSKTCTNEKEEEESSYELRIETKGVTWKEFSKTFKQKPAACGEDVPQNIDAMLNRSESNFIQQFNVQKSTEENYKADDMNFYGAFAHIRETLVSMDDYFTSLGLSFAFYQGAYHCNDICLI